MTFRPSAFRVAGMAAFGLAVGVSAFADSAPVVVRVSGLVCLIAAPVIVVLGIRLRVVVGEHSVEVRRLRGWRVFSAGQATFRRFAVPGAMVGPDNAAVQITGIDGGSVTIALTWFKSRDQREFMRRLGAALG